MPEKPHSATVRRMKSYTGGQGYVYQYYFVGNRPALREAGETPATEYIFDVSSDRKLTFAVSIFLPESAIEDWKTKHNRSLTEAERYGAVKMRLFQAFDEIENLLADGRRLMIDQRNLEELTSTLGVD